MREPEVFPGYPDRILPKDEAAAAELKKRTLTNLYKARPHGWITRARRLLTEDETLARLFRLNQERARAKAFRRSASRYFYQRIIAACE